MFAAIRALGPANRDDTGGGWRRRRRRRDYRTNHITLCFRPLHTTATGINVSRDIA